MSRSYRHSGWIQDRSCKKAGKRFANKKVRRTMDVCNGCSYKKLFESWDISDFTVPTRGYITFESRRKGRLFKKLKYDKKSKSWWWLFDQSDAEDIHKDWMK